MIEGKKAQEGKKGQSILRNPLTVNLHGEIVTVS